MLVAVRLKIAELSTLAYNDSEGLKIGRAVLITCSQRQWPGRKL